MASSVAELGMSNAGGANRNLYRWRL